METLVNQWLDLSSSCFEGILQQSRNRHGYRESGGDVQILEYPTGWQTKPGRNSSGNSGIGGLDRVGILMQEYMLYP